MHELIKHEIFRDLNNPCLCDKCKHPVSSHPNGTASATTSSKRDNSLKNCWDAICNNRVSLENGFLVLSSADGTRVAWGVAYSCTEELLVRDEYNRIYNKMNTTFNLKAAHLSGSKGIGKTIFLFWLIYKLVSSRACGAAIPSILLIVGKNKTQYLLRYSSGNPEVVSWTGQEQVDYILGDVSYDVCVEPVHWSLLISTYGATDLREYMDFLGNLAVGKGVNTLGMVMGAMTYDEIMKIAPDRRLGEFSFLIFGGSIRMVGFIRSVKWFGGKVVTPTQRSDLKEVMLEFLAGSKYVDGTYDDLIEKSCDVICSQIDINYSTPEAIIHSLFVHSIVQRDVNGDFQAVPTAASSFMGYYASFLLEQHTADTLSNLRLILKSPGMGNLFERHVMNTIFKKVQEWR